MNEKQIKEVLQCDDYIECMRIIYRINPKSYKEGEMPESIQKHLKQLRNNGLDINKPIQIRKK